MTLVVSLEPTVEADIIELSATMRDIDKQECYITAAGMSIYSVLKLSCAMTAKPLTGRVNGKLVAVFGVSKLSALSSQGVPWLLGTDLVERYAFAFARKNRIIVKQWQEQFPVMRNFVHADNEISIRWLRWLGFEIKKPIKYGTTNELFCPFELRSKYHV